MPGIERGQYCMSICIKWLKLWQYYANKDKYIDHTDLYWRRNRIYDDVSND